MLTADQIQVLGDKAEDLLAPVVEFLLGDIARRVSEAGQLTSTAAYLTWVAQRLGKSQNEVKKEIAKRLDIALEEVEQLMKQVAKTGYFFNLNRLPTSQAIPFAANSSLQQILDGYVALAQEDLKNITQTLGFVTPYGEAKALTEAYRDTCDFAFKKVTTGAQDFTSAVRDAMKNLADKGIVQIDYESGVHTSAEAAARRSILGGMGLMQEEISQKNHDELGYDGWEISAHRGSAPDHEPFQGKQYTDTEYKALNGRLKRRIGTLNCGHVAFPVMLGIQMPMYTEEDLEKLRLENEAGVKTKEGKHYTLYEATQHQRAMERGIRKRQRMILLDKGSGDEEKLQWDRVKLIRQKENYKRFSEETGLRMKHERTEVVEFTNEDWKDARSAVKSAKRESEVSSSKRRKSTVVHEGMQDKSFSFQWDKNIGSTSWEKHNRTGMQENEFQIKDQKRESATLYGANGVSIFEKDGDAHDVSFTDIEIKKMRNGVLTHNHPNGSCFSTQDINILRRGRLSEIRVVTHKGVYRLQAPQKWNKDISTLDKIDFVYYNIDKDVSPSIYARAAYGDISYSQAEMLSQEAVIMELANRYGLGFAFDTWNDIWRE